MYEFVWIDIKQPVPTFGSRTLRVSAHAAIGVADQITKGVTDRQCVQE